MAAVGKGPKLIAISILARRQLRCLTMHLFFSFIAFFTWGSSVWLRLGTWGLLASFLSLRTLSSLILFWASSFSFMGVYLLIVEPTYTPWPCIQDIIANVSLALSSFSVKRHALTRAERDAVARVRALVLRYFSFCGLATSGFLGMMSFLYALGVPIQTAPQGSGAALTLKDFSAAAALTSASYAFYTFWRRDWVLSFPILQRVLWFHLKAAFSHAACFSLVVNLIAFFVWAAMAAMSCLWKGFSHGSCSFQHSPLLFLAGTLSVFSWRAGIQIVEIVLTEKEVFVTVEDPRAESAGNPTKLLMSALDVDVHGSNLIRHLAMLDLCHVSEQSMEEWRRSAMFEDAVVYNKAIDTCLATVDGVTKRIKATLEATSSKPWKSQRQAAVAVADTFREYQLCVWSVRAAASLTAASRKEDSRGIAQLNGCNGRVLSSLLSCLLAAEAVAGQGVGVRGVGGPTTLGSAFAAFFQQKGLSGGNAALLAKASGSIRPYVIFKQVHAMVDTLRNGIYTVVAAFEDDLSNLYLSESKLSMSMADDWLGALTPAHGTRSTHVQKLKMFLACKI